MKTILNLKNTSNLDAEDEPPNSSHPKNLTLPVLQAYMETDVLSNDQLYSFLIDSGHLEKSEIETKQPVGSAGVPISLTKRRIRWWQQTMKRQGIIERVPNERGLWRLAAGLIEDNNDKKLTPAPPGVMMIGCSTDLGVAIWGSCLDVFGQLEENIAVCITSPPYPLSKARAYGNVSQHEWVDWICRHLDPIVKRLLPGGSIAINISNDIFKPGLPARSTYRERFVIAMEDRFGLHKMDDIPWVNDSKPPSPYQWASKHRMQLNTGYEPIIVFCNDPLRSFANNQRVLVPHSESHLKLINSGGEKRARSNSDGAYQIRVGAYANPTTGKIPKNVLRFGHACADQRHMRQLAKAAGLPVHGASMPLRLAIFLVQFLSRPGDLVVDPFGGTLTTAKACESLGRMWLATEIMAEYIMAGGYRFKN